MIRSASTLALLLVLSSSLLFAGAVKTNSASAYSNGTSILLRWLGDDETGVAGYEVARKAGANGTFIVLGAKQIRSDKTYDFTDNTAFRITDDIYQYRITPIYSDGRVVTPDQSTYVSVAHSVSSVRRTWGSIKAMFR